MNARVSKANFLSTRAAVVGLAVLAVMVGATAANYLHVRVLARRAQHGSAAISRPEKSALTLGSAPQELQAKLSRGAHQLPADAMPVISAMLGQHSPQYTAKKARSGYSTENPANHLTARFTSEGVGLQRLHAQWRMQLTGWGYDGNVTALAKVAPRATANRVEYARENLTEWYVNGPLGLEQSFRIAHAPWSENKGQHTLTLSFALKGNWNNSAGTRNQEILLQDESGRPALRYGGLTAHDASGRVLTSWMDVHAQNLQLEVAAEGAEFPVTIDPTYSEIAQLNPPANANIPAFGIMAAINDDGTVIVAGTCGYDQSLEACPNGGTTGATLYQGQAYVFVEPTTGWATTAQPAATLSAGSDGMQGDTFGMALAISGDGMTIVVSAPGHGCQTESTGFVECNGRAYVYTASDKTAAAWAAAAQTTPAILTPSESTESSFEGDSFGIPIAIDYTGATIVTRQFPVGTPYSHLDLYLRPQNGWVNATENAQLQSSDIGSFDNFGTALAISSDSSTIVAGAFGAGSGGAYVFTEPSGGWNKLQAPPAAIQTETVRLKNSDNAGDSGFGGSVAVDYAGDTIVVGAPYQKENVGEDYIFLEPMYGWAVPSPLYETTELTAPPPGGPNGFGGGNSISNDGSVIVIDDYNTLYLFTRPGTSWPSGPFNPGTSLTPTLTTPSASGIYGTLSGNTVASGATGTLVVSAPGNNSGVGSLFVYEAQAGAGPTYTISATDGSGQSAPTGSEFATLLAATVVDEKDNPVSGVTVTFTAPSSGASGTFANGTTTTTASTSYSGLATASAFTANNTAGSYAVTATAPGVTGTASFSLSNTAAAVNTTTTITSTSSSYHGQAFQGNVTLVGTTPVTVNFTVQPASGNATPTGNVVVSDGLGDTCSPSPATLTAGKGSCAVTISQLPASGTVSLVATYSPDPTDSSNGLQGSVSSPFTENVVEVVACGASVPPTTITGKASTTLTFTVCLAGNVNSVPVAALTSDCLPYAACNLNVTPLAGSTNVYVVSVTITTCNTCGHGTASLPVALTRSEPRKPPFLWFGIFLVFVIALQLVRQYRVRPRRQWTAASLLFAAALFCGGYGCSGSGAPETPPGTYMLNVKVTAGAYSVTVPLTITVIK